MAEVKIRLRNRRGYVREAGGYRAWDEYQVVQGRKVIHRADLREQAEKWCRENGHSIIVEIPHG